MVLKDSQVFLLSQSKAFQGIRIELCTNVNRLDPPIMG